MQIGLASVHEIDRLWPQLVAGVTKAIKRADSRYTAGDLWQMCRSGNGYLVLVYDQERIWSAGIWRFENDRFRCVMMHGDNMSAWLNLVREYITRIAKENGAVALTCSGRRGWARMFGAEQNGQDYEVMI
jgi:hypothetical protein